MKQLKPIPGFPDYSVTNDGDLYSHKNNKTRLLKTSADRSGYRYTVARVDGLPKTLKTHRAVALAWLPPPQAHQTEIRHLNGSNTDNRAANLQWGTKSENAKDSIKHGNHYHNTKHTTRGAKIALFRRLQHYAAANYLPIHDRKNRDKKRVRIWIALRKKIKQDALRLDQTTAASLSPTQER